MIGKLSLLVLGVFLILGATACKGKIAYIGPDGNVWVVKPDGTNLTQITTDATGTDYGLHDQYVLYEYPNSFWQRPIWSPDGSELAYFRTSGVGADTSTVEFFVTDFTGPPKKVHTIFIGRAGFDIVPTAWTADGQGIYFEECIGGTIHMDFTCQIKLVLIASGETSTLFTIEKGYSASILNPSPNGKYLAWHKSYVEGVGNPCIFNLETRQNSCLNEFRGRSSWSPDGTKLAIDDCGYGCRRGALAIFNPEDWSSVPLLQNTEKFGYERPVWSPTGDKIAYIMLDQTDLSVDPLHGTPSLWVINTNGTNPVKVADSLAGGRYAFSPDGKYLVYTKSAGPYPDKTAELWVTSVDASLSWKIADGFQPVWSAN